MQRATRFDPRVVPGLFHRLVCFEDWMTRLFEADSERAYRVCFALLMVCLLTVFGLVWATGCAHQMINPWDSVNLLDAGWRVYQGQVPHRDFFCHLGVVYVGLVAFGMKLGGPSASAMAYAGLLPALPLGLCCWWLARRRFAAFPALVLSAMVGALPLGTSQLGMVHDYASPSYAMQYNRLGWALMCVVLVQLLFPPRKEPTTRRLLTEYLISGLVISALLFTKVNYAIVAVGLLPLGMLFRPRLKAWAALLGGVVIGTALIAAILPLDVSAMLADQQSIAAVHRLEKRLSEIREIIGDNLPLILALLGTALFMTQPILGRREILGGSKAIVSWIGFLFAAAVSLLVGIAICSTNCQRTAIPTFALSALFLLEGFRRSRTATLGSEPPPADDRVRWLLGGWVFLLLSAPIAIYDAMSVSYCYLWHEIKAPVAPSIVRVPTDMMSDMLFPCIPGDAKTREALVQKILARGIRHPDMSSCEYAVWLSDGAALLERWTDDRSRVFTMDFLNSYSFIMKLPSPRGTPLCLHLKHLVNDDHHPAVERVFEEVTHVMVPKRYLVAASGLWIDTCYGPYMRDHYTRVATSDLWELYVRNESPWLRSQSVGQGASQGDESRRSGASVDGMPQSLFAGTSPAARGQAGDHRLGTNQRP